MALPHFRFFSALSAVAGLASAATPATATHRAAGPSAASKPTLLKARVRRKTTGKRRGSVDEQRLRLADAVAKRERRALRKQDNVQREANGKTYARWALAARA